MLAATLLCTPSPAAAQAVTGTLLGNITDASGAAVPGATVTATELQTNTSRTTVSNETGYYIFSSLQNGTYSVSAELQGFRKVIRQNVKVDVNTTHARGSDAGARADDRGRDRRRGDAAPADGPDRHRAHHRVEDGDRDSARLQPQLPGHCW